MKLLVLVSRFVAADTLLSIRYGEISGASRFVPPSLLPDEDELLLIVGSLAMVEQITRVADLLPGIEVEVVAAGQPTSRRAAAALARAAMSNPETTPARDPSDPRRKGA